MSVDNEEYVKHLVIAVPELGSLLAEHIEDHDEVLPHLLFGDVTRWAQAQAFGSPQVDRLLQIFEVDYDQAPADVSEMIHVSFLENLEADSWVWSRLGPRLSKAGRGIYGNNPEYYPPGLAPA